MIKRIVFFFIIMLTITTNIFAGGNQEIVIEVKTTGDERQLIKTIIENVLRYKGYTITTTEDNSNNTFQKKNNSEMYNIKTGPQKGNKIIPSFVVVINCEVKYESANIRGSYNNNNHIQPYFEYDGRTLAVLTYQLVSYETDEILNVNPNQNPEELFRGEVFEGSSNNFSFGANSRYGYGDFETGRNSDIATYNAIMDALENGLSSRFDAIASNVCNSYYTQTVPGYKPYPPAQPPVNFPNINNSNSNQTTTSYQIVQPNPTTTNPDLLYFSALNNRINLNKNQTLILDISSAYTVYTDDHVWFVNDGRSICYHNGQTEKVSNFLQIQINSLTCKKLAVQINNVVWTFNIN